MLVSSGRLLPEHRAGDRGDRAARSCAERAVGEIALRSPCLMSGYDHNADATAEAIRDGRYFTGDLGYLAAGELFVTGRVRDLIIVGGRNIYPQDVEQVVERVDGVVAGRVVAVGVPEPRASAPRASRCSPRPRRPTEARRSELAAGDPHRGRRANRGRAPASSVCSTTASLLKSSSGKPARGANRERFLSDADAASHRPTPPAGEAGLGRATATARRVVEEVLANLGDEGGPLDDRTPLLTSGRIDSFGMVELFAGLEMACNCSISDELRAARPSGSTRSMRSRERSPRSAAHRSWRLRRRGRAWRSLDPESIPMRYGRHATPRRRTRRSGRATTRHSCASKGVRCGPGLKVLGPLLLQIDGRPENVHIGADVTLMPGAHLKNRENGTIILHDGVKLDTTARLVAANDARLELGENVAIGMGTVVNAGRDVLLGRGCLTAAHCVINASDHGIAAGAPIQSQPFDHGADLHR